MSITYCKCVFVALGMYHANRYAPCYTVICGLADCTIFVLIILYRHEFRKKKTLLDIKCILIFPTNLCEIIVRSTPRDIIITVGRSACKVAVILVRF